jgi:MFS family permease
MSACRRSLISGVSAVDRLAAPPTTSTTPTAGSGRGFWVVVGGLLTVMIAAGAPSPLYVVYEERIGFSATVLTVIFAVYVVALLATLLSVGSLSDHIGRKPVLVAAFGLEIVSMALFLPADSVGMLIVARVVQGVATGAALGALGAALVDTQPPGTQRGVLMNSICPAIGLAAGAFGAGVLVEHAPSPTRSVFLVLIALLLAELVGLLLMPETVGRRPGAFASLRPNLRVAPATRPAFTAMAPVFVATWAVGGFYLALGGSLAATVFGLTDHLVGGAVIGAMNISGGIASYVLNRAAPRRTMRIGAVALTGGLLTTLAAVGTVSTPLLFAGSVVTGFGFGASFLGALKTVMAAVGPDERAATMSAMLTVCYVAFSVPAIVAGYLSTRIGLGPTAVGYCVVVIVVVLAVTAVERIRERRAADR